MTLRLAEAPDAAAIAALWNGMIAGTLATFTTELKTPEGIADLIAQRGEGFWVAEQAGVVVGFVTFGPFRSGPGYARTVEHSIVLSDAARGRGLGRALLTRGVQAAAAQGAHVMVAAVSSANPGAVRFHQRMGFAEVGRMPEVGFKAGRYLDLILLQKMLDPA